jgi:hypothetical protein
MSGSRRPETPPLAARRGDLCLFRFLVCFLLFHAQWRVRRMVLAHAQAACLHDSKRRAEEFSVAEYSFTGMASSPKLSERKAIDRTATVLVLNAASFFAS